MPASFFVFLVLIPLVVATVVLAIAHLIVSLIRKKPKGTYRHRGCMLPLPAIALGVFLSSLMIYDVLVAELTNTFPNFSDWEQAVIAKHYILRPGELCNGYSKERLANVHLLYIDGEESVVVSSQNYYPAKDSVVFLYRFAYKNYQFNRELLDSDPNEDQLWNRYGATHYIDKDEIMTTEEKLQDLIWWHLPFNAFLALLTTILAIYAVRRSCIKKMKNGVKSK